MKIRIPNKMRITSVDQTAARALDTTYTNGNNNRLLTVSMRFLNSVAFSTADAIMYMGTSTPPTEYLMGRIELTNGGVAKEEDNRLQLSGIIQPNLKYRIFNNSGGGGLVSVERWFETDFIIAL